MKNLDSSGPYEYEAKLVSVVRIHLRELPRCHVCQRLAVSFSPEPEVEFGADFTCEGHEHPGTTGEGPFPLPHAETMQELLKLVSPTGEDLRQAKAVLLNCLCRPEWLRGVGEGQDVNGLLRLEVRVSEITPEVELVVPASIEGIEVHMEAVGDIVAQGLPPATPSDYPGTD
jgi:hypothetical protein